jgi:type III secretion control protein HpaP
MTRPRQIDFRRLVVHRPDPTEPRPTDASREPSSFAALLRRRPVAPPAPAEVPGCTEPPASAVEAIDDDKGHGQDGSSREPPPQEDDVASEWAGALMPTSASLDLLLAHAIPACDDAAPPPDLLASVAQTIAGFCNERAVDDSEGWNVRMPLRPDLFEDTTLELAISSSWLQLRFVTADARSRRLISQHQDALHSLLARLLRRQREISIAID